MLIWLRIFKCFTIQICHLFFTEFRNFWCITRLSTTNHRWVINAQTDPVFLDPPCTYSTVAAYRQIWGSSRLAWSKDQQPPGACAALAK